ncbi:class I SAM-dependent methyltransferase [Candidatus Binatia bacterium]|jgi:methyltransferase (TIGR00027 family)|nr:class I SAM-dependent methyltransferase [Candidatus Binatia bacterium]
MKASRTALAAALMRAIHSRLDRPRVIDDPWGDRLVTDDEKAELARRIRDEASPEARARLAALGSDGVDAVLRRNASYGGVVLRTRWAEDALADAVARGVRQYVLVGAGLDSFCVRQPPYARALDVYEVDHPASQALKRERLAAAEAPLPANVRFVAADLATDDLGTALAGAGFRSDVPAFFSWLGVTVYLTRAANTATLRAIARCAAAGSELAFTYLDQRALDAGAPQLEERRAQRAAQGEPWLSGFDPTTLASDLRALGLTLVEDLDGRALTARYCAARSDGLAASLSGHVARASVAG